MTRVKKFPIPPSRDPFCNTPMIPAGYDPDTGEDRYWTSTWNANVGCLGALITPSGKSRIYRIQKSGQGIAGCGGYSAVLTDNDTIWLYADLRYPVKLTLSTGEYEYFDSEAGIGQGLVFAGAQYDAATHKILAFACVDGVLTGVSFDTESKKAVKVYQNFTKATLANGGFANGDGTYTVRFTTGYSSLYRWDPVQETLEEKCAVDTNISATGFSKNIRDERGFVYVPYMGWLSPFDYTFQDGPKPDKDMVWFGRIGNTAYGKLPTPLGIEVYRWDMENGNTSPLCEISNGSDFATILTEKGDILGVTYYGEVNRFSSKDGSLLFSMTLDSDAVGRVDCLIRVNDHTLLGTPFITQRYWLLNMQTGEGFDAGRAAAGGGEVLRVWNLNGNVYMASYTEGILTEYDPKKRINFPENPRMVAKAPHGMRPVASTEDGECLYYACNHHYGILGCVLTRYNTVTGEAFYRDEPYPGQHVISMCYRKQDGVIVAGTTYQSDCNVTEPSTDKCYFVKIDPKTLEFGAMTEAPAGSARVNVIGPLDEENYLALITRKDASVILASYSAKEESFTLYPEKNYADYRISQILYAGKPGMFLILSKGSIELWDITKDAPEVITRFLSDDKIYQIFLSGKSIQAVTPTDVYDIADALEDYLE